MLPLVFSLYVNLPNDNGNSLIKICCPCVFSLYVNPSNNNGSSLKYATLTMSLACM